MHFADATAPDSRSCPCRTERTVRFTLLPQGTTRQNTPDVQQFVEPGRLPSFYPSKDLESLTRENCVGDLVANR